MPYYYFLKVGNFAVWNCSLLLWNFNYMCEGKAGGLLGTPASNQFWQLQIGLRVVPCVLGAVHKLCQPKMGRIQTPSPLSLPMSAFLEPPLILPGQFFQHIQCHPVYKWPKTHWTKPFFYKEYQFVKILHPPLPTAIDIISKSPLPNTILII